MSAAKGIGLTAVIARRKKGGKLVLLTSDSDGIGFTETELDDSADRALDLYDRVKKSKGEKGRFTEASIFLRANSRRGHVKFA
jgi:hypothetical protein